MRSRERVGVSRLFLRGLTYYALQMCVLEMVPLVFHTLDVLCMFHVAHVVSLDHTSSSYVAHRPLGPSAVRWHAGKGSEGFRESH